MDTPELVATFLFIRVEFREDTVLHKILLIDLYVYLSNSTPMSYQHL